MEEQKVLFGQEEFVWKYGRKGDKSLKLWPFSMGDQLKVSKLIATVAKDVLAGAENDEDNTNVAVVQRFIDILPENIVKIAALASDMDENDEQLKDIPNHVTNMQLAEFANYIWEVNYGSVRKNYANLIEDFKNLLVK